MRCAGIHRGLGVHVSKVRSTTLDTWLPGQVALMDALGNARANAHWEARLGPGVGQEGTSASAAVAQTAMQGGSSSVSTGAGVGSVSSSSSSLLRPPHGDMLGLQRFIRLKYAEGAWAVQGAAWPPPEVMQALAAAGSAGAQTHARTHTHVHGPVCTAVQAGIDSITCSGSSSTLAAALPAATHPAASTPSRSQQMVLSPPPGATPHTAATPTSAAAAPAHMADLLSLSDTDSDSEVEGAGGGVPQGQQGAGSEGTMGSAAGQYCQVNSHFRQIMHIP